MAKVIIKMVADDYIEDELNCDTAPQAEELEKEINGWLDKTKYKTEISS